ncbi:unnamed protein product [Brachionus calyciflorus]|uniref:Uncharacterized protein n=1 Tax=Brachionus calyciflorus TaxID=104777 RepID=A0A813LZZ3_9BILA|nr:unnamed protein product [Brachionus calyciflorus]
MTKFNFVKFFSTKQKSSSKSTSRLQSKSETNLISKSSKNNLSKKCKFLKNNSTKRPTELIHDEISNSNQQIDLEQIKKTKKARIDESIRSETYTFEQMYNDNSIYNQLDKSYSIANQLSSESSDSSYDELSETFLNSNRQNSIQINFFDNISIQKLDEEIKARFVQLKQCSNLLKINVPVQITMVESLYDLKIENIKLEAFNILKEFDERVHNQKENEKTSLNKIMYPIIATRNFLKNYSRKRTTPVEISKLEKTFIEQKHNNYYLIERENIERKYENKIREIQFEILNVIYGIELQLKDYLRQKERMVIETKQNTQSRHRKRCTQLLSNHNISHVGLYTKRNKLNYSTEIGIQKRIRVRQQTKDGEIRKSIRNSSNSTF